MEKLMCIHCAQQVAEYKLVLDTRLGKFIIPLCVACFWFYNLGVAESARLELKYNTEMENYLAN